MNTGPSRSLLNTVTILSVGWAAPLIAQDTGGGAPQTQPTLVNPSEIVVTATRQSQVLSKVPVSIQAFSKQQMDEQGVRKIDDIAQLTPGLSFQRSGYGNGSISNISIRGINSTVGAATTGIYIDDTPIQVRQIGYTASNPYPQVFDLDRVEVVRGPQGTLFGAGAEGGAVRFITPAPNLTHYEGYARSELAFTEHGDPSYEGGAAVGGPIVADKLGFRVSAWYRRDGGYVDRTDYSGNVTAKNSNSQKTLALRGALTFQPTDDLKITPSVFYQREHVDDSSVLWAGLSEPHGDYKNASVIAQPGTDKFVLPALNVTYSNDTLSVISVSSYLHRKSDTLFDYTAFTNGTFAYNSVPFIPGYLATSQMNNEQKNFTQEVRVQSSNPDARLKWVIGGFYSHAKQNSYQNTVDPYFAELISIITGGAPVEAVTGSPVLPGNVVYLNTNRSTDKQLAGFAQVDWRPIDSLTATAGVRVSRSIFDFSTHQAGPGAGTISLDASGKQKETPVTPKFGLDYRVSGDTILYASAAKGFRTGGVNSPVNAIQCAPNLAALGLSAAPSSYKSDSLWSYEAGAKGKAIDRTLQYQASAYYIKWDNIQQFVYLPLCGGGFVNNSGRASSRGFDLAVQIRLSADWSFGITTGYVDAHYDRSISAGLGSNYVTKGDKLPGSPWSINLSLTGQFGVGEQRFYTRIDYDHEAAYSRGIVGQDPANGAYDPGATPDQETNDLSLRLGTRFSGFDVSLFVNNLLDQKPELSKAHNSVYDPVYTYVTVRPRTAGITGIYKF